MAPFSTGADVASARVRWSLDAGRGVEVPPLVDAGKLYVATTDRRLHSIDSDTGKRIWRERLNGSLAALPVLERGDLYAATNYPDGSVYRVNVQKRKVLWKNQVGEAAGSAVFFEGAVLVTTKSGKVYGLSPADGQPIWVTNLESSTWGEAELNPGRALFLVPSRSGILFGVDARSGEKRWTAELDEPLVGVASDRDGVAAVAVSGMLFYMNIGNGQLLWKKPLGLKASSSPLLTDSLIVIAGLDGIVLALDRDQGREAWRRDLKGPFRSRPALKGDCIVAAAASGLVWALDLPAGRVTGRVRHPEPVLVPPVATDAGWVVAGERGLLVSYEWGAGAP